MADELKDVLRGIAAEMRRHAAKNSDPMAGWWATRISVAIGDGKDRGPLDVPALVTAVRMNPTSDYFRLTTAGQAVPCDADHPDAMPMFRNRTKPDAAITPTAGAEAVEAYVAAETAECNCPGGAKSNPHHHAPNCPVRLAYTRPTSATTAGEAVLALREAMQPVAEWMNAGGHDDDAYERGCHAAFKLLREHGPTLVNALAAPQKFHYCGDEYLREIVRDEFASALLAAGIQFMPGGYMDAVADEVVRRAFDPHEKRHSGGAK